MNEFYYWQFFLFIYFLFFRWCGIKLLHQGKEREEVWDPPRVLFPQGGSAAQPTENVLRSSDSGCSLRHQGCVRVCVCVRSKGEAGRTTGISFLDGTETKTVAKVEEERTKRTDQWTEASFLLDEPTSLHRPCPSLFVFLSVWLPTTSPRDLAEGVLSVAQRFLIVTLDSSIF